MPGWKHIHTHTHTHTHQLHFPISPTDLRDRVSQHLQIRCKWNFCVGIPWKPLEGGQAAHLIPLLLPLLCAIYSAEPLSTVSDCTHSALWPRQLTRMEPSSKYPCPLDSSWVWPMRDTSRRWSLEGQRNQYMCPLDSLPVRPCTDSGCFPLPKATALGTQPSLTAHSCSSLWVPATIPSHHRFKLTVPKGSLLLLTGLPLLTSLPFLVHFPSPYPHLCEESIL